MTRVRPNSRNKRTAAGIVLPGVLYLLVLVGFLVAAGVFTTARLRRGTAHRLLDASLGAAADDALAVALAEWPSESRSRLVVGAADSSIVPTHADEEVHALVRAIRLSPTLYWLVASVRDDRWPEVSRRVNLVVRVRPPVRTGVVALSSAGDTRLGPAARLLPDTGTACEGARLSPIGSGVAAVALAAEAHLVLDSGRASADSVRVVVPDATDSLSLVPLGGDAWQRLTGRASVRYAPGSSVTAGEHALAWAQGDLTLSGGAGRGMLLVDGRLTLAGPLTFTGLIVARGGVATSSDGVVITGLLVSTARNGSAVMPVALTHAAEVRASRCAAIDALVAAAPPGPVHGRAWAELF